MHPQLQALRHPLLDRASGQQRAACRTDESLLSAEDELRAWRSCLVLVTDTAKATGVKSNQNIYIYMQTERSRAGAIRKAKRLWVSSSKLGTGKERRCPAQKCLPASQLRSSSRCNEMR